MKRLLMVLAVALAVSVASAQGSSYFGVYLLGGQYTINGNPTGPGGLRFGVGLPLFGGLLGGYGFLGLDASADFLLPGGVISTSPLQWYYGAGVGANAFFASGGSVFVLNPRGLVGLDYPLDKGLSIFGEIQLGLNIYLGGGGSLIGFGPGGRLGLNFR